jgi:hypothetical protein
VPALIGGLALLPPALPLLVLAAAARDARTDPETR